MSSTDDIRTGAKRAGASARDADDLANQIEAIRSDLQSLSSTVTRIAKGQVSRAQDKAMETAYEAEEREDSVDPEYARLAGALPFVDGTLEYTVYAPVDHE